MVVGLEDLVRSSPTQKSALVDGIRSMKLTCRIRAQASTYIPNRDKHSVRRGG